MSIRAAGRAATSRTAGGTAPGGDLPRALAPALSVVLVLIAVWLLSGVGLLQSLDFLGYQALFILLPGCLFERVLRPGHRAWLDRLGTGWALGYAIELLLFAITAALGARGLLPWLILAVALACGTGVLAGGGDLWFATPGRGRRRPGQALLRLGGGTRRGEAEAERFSWGVAGLAALAVVYVAIAYFTTSPLPGSVPSVTYYADFPFHLGIAAEALHHWPIGDPKVAGTSLPYQIFDYMHLASVAEITRLPLPVILLRLDIPMLIVGFVVGVAACGRALSTRPPVGLLAVVLVLFVGELHPNPNDHLTFLNSFFSSEYTSPTFIFGLVIFVPALQALVELTASDAPVQNRGRLWILLAILLAACGGAKATILPVLLGATAIAAAVWMPRERGRMVAAVKAAVLLAGILAFYQLSLYRGFDGGLRLDPPGSVRAMEVMALIRSHISSGLGADLFWVAAVPLGILGFCAAPLAGIGAFVLRTVRLAPRHVLLLGATVAGFVPFLAFSQFGSSQNFFTYYGYVAGTLVSAEGLLALWQRWVSRPPRLLPWAGWSVGSVALFVALIYGLQTLSPYPLARYGIWFGSFLLLLVLAAAWAHRAPAPRRGPRWMVILVGVILFGALEAPLETLPGLVSALRTDRPPYDATTRLLTRGLYRGLVWVERHTSPDAVLAVNNQYVDTAHHVPGYMYYSAFTERRIFLEGWAYTARASRLGAEAVTFHGLIAFPRRLALNRAVFVRADPVALSTLTNRYGVRYLLVDRLHGSASPRLTRLGRLIYRSPALLVYAVG